MANKKKSGHQKVTGFNPFLAKQKQISADMDLNFLERLKNDLRKKKATLKSDVEILSGDILNPSFRKAPIQWVKYTWQKKRHKTDFIFVKIELDVGDVIQGRVPLEGEDFFHNGVSYLIDDKFKYLDRTLGGYCLDYHEGFCLPIKRRFPVNQIRKSFAQNSKGYEIEYAVNPVTLATFLQGNVIEQMIRGASGEDNSMGNIKLLIYVLIGISALSLILTLRKASKGG